MTSLMPAGKAGCAKAVQNQSGKRKQTTLVHAMRSCYQPDLRVMCAWPAGETVAKGKGAHEQKGDTRKNNAGASSAVEWAAPRVVSVGGWGPIGKWPGTLVANVILKEMAWHICMRSVATWTKHKPTATIIGPLDPTS